MAKKNKVIIPIEEKDLNRYRIDEKTYQFYVKQGLHPYRSSSGNIKWLTDFQYTIQLSKDINKKGHKRKRYEIRTIDKTIITFEKILFGLGTILFLLLAYYIGKIIGLF